MQFVYIKNWEVWLNCLLHLVELRRICLVHMLYSILSGQMQFWTIGGWRMVHSRRILLLRLLQHFMKIHLLIAMVLLVLRQNMCDCRRIHFMNFTLGFTGQIYILLFIHSFYSSVRPSVKNKIPTEYISWRWTVPYLGTSNTLYGDGQSHI